VPGGSIRFSVGSAAFAVRNQFLKQLNCEQSRSTCALSDSLDFAGSESGIGVGKEKRKMSQWNEPLPEPVPDLIEPPLDSDVETGIDNPDDLDDTEDLDDPEDPEDEDLDEDDLDEDDLDEDGLEDDDLEDDDETDPDNPENLEDEEDILEDEDDEPEDEDLPLVDATENRR
jgi:hypothetical protein